MKCGTQIPDESAFCNRCGAPQSSGAIAVPVTEQVKWEECEIVAKKNFASGDFVAEVFGPNGHYIAGKVRCNLDLKNGWTNRGILDRFIASLLAEGWEAQPRTGHEWYSYRFRRQLK